MIDHINYLAIFGSLLAAVATGAGAIPIFFKKELSKSSLDVGLGFSAGIMLVAAFVSLILPGMKESVAVYGNTFSVAPAIFGLVLGYLFIIFIHEILPHEHFFKNKDMETNQQISRMSLIVLAICLHNIPEGLAVGVGFGAGTPSEGMSLAVAIAIQNMPEGLVVAFGLLREGSTRAKAFWMAVASGFIEPIAAIFGYIATTISHYSLPIALGFAGGAMLFVLCQEIFPELFRQGHEKRATLGVISGVVLMLLIDFYFSI